MMLIRYIVYPLFILPLNLQTLTTILRGTKGVHHQITRVLQSSSLVPTSRHDNPNPDGREHTANPTLVLQSSSLVPTSRHDNPNPDGRKHTANPTFPPIPDQLGDPDTEEPTSSPSCNESKRRYLKGEKSLKGNLSKTAKTKKTKKTKSPCKTIKTSRSAKASKIQERKSAKAPEITKTPKASKG